MATSNFIIVDSSGLISLVVDTDSNHTKALDFAKKFDSTELKALLPAEVFAETVNILGKKFGHKYAAGTAQSVLESAAFIVVPTSDISRQDALELFRTVSAGVSYTDCLVMKVADEYKTKTIFGFDKQFENAGYTTVNLALQKSS